MQGLGCRDVFFQEFGVQGHGFSGIWGAGTWIFRDLGLHIIAVAI